MFALKKFEMARIENKSSFPHEILLNLSLYKSYNTFCDFTSFSIFVSFSFWRHFFFQVAVFIGRGDFKKLSIVAFHTWCRCSSQQSHQSNLYLMGNYTPSIPIHNNQLGGGASCKSINNNQPGDGSICKWQFNRQ